MRYAWISHSAIDINAHTHIGQGLRFPLARSPEASETQLGRVKAICDLARLASGIIVLISVFNSLLNNVFCLCTAWHTHTVFSYVYGTQRIRCLTHKLQQCLQTRTNTQQTIQNYNVRYHPLSTTP